MAQQSKKIGLVLGDMFELGDTSGEEHKAIGHLLNENPPNVFIGVGEGMQQAVQVFRGNGKAFLTTAEAKPQVAKLLQGLDVILIKGSRGMALEKLLDELQ